MKVKKLFATLCLYGLLGNAWGEPVVLSPDMPQRYAMARSNSLGGITAQSLCDPGKRLNTWHTPPQSKNPQPIYLGDTFPLSYRVEGQSLPTPQHRLPLYTLSPKIRVMEQEKAIPAIPAEAIQPFLVYPRVVSQAVLENAPYVVAGAEGRLILGIGDKAYVRGLSDTAPAQYGLYRVGRAYRDPAHPNEILGYGILFIGVVEVERFGDPASVYIQSATREVLVGDRLLPSVDQALEPCFFPHPPSVPVEGQIIAVVGGHSQIGRNEVVVLNLGAKDGIEKGVVLGIYQTDGWVRDTADRQPKDKVQLPGKRVGAVMIFRAFDRISYALVMRAKRVIHLYNAVHNP